MLLHVTHQHALWSTHTIYEQTNIYVLEVCAQVFTNGVYDQNKGERSQSVKWETTHDSPVNERKN